MDEQLTKKERREKRRQEKNESAEGKTKRSDILRALLWGGVVLLVLGSIFVLSQFSSKNQKQQGAILPVTDVGAGEYVKGNKDASLTLIEYSDFQCPACAAYYPIVRQAAADFEKQMRFVYRHFPLSQHANALSAARAAEAAGKQGAFWEMHNILFEKQAEWSEQKDSEKIFIGYAESLGLDRERFEKELRSEEAKAKIDADAAGGIQAGVNATPTFFLNGKKLENIPRSYDEFRKALQGAAGNN